MTARKSAKVQANIYQLTHTLLYEHFGPQGWWPGETPFEVMVGAVLTQNTSWSNVAKAIDNLKNAGLLTFESLAPCSAETIAPYIRPSGYYNLKARRLRNLLDLIEIEYGGELESFLTDDLPTAREKLLGVRGIGPETADSILLYACGHPIFVVDMYTHRVFSRHNLVLEESDYHTIQQVFMDHLPAEPQLFNEFHALIVRVATTYCKKNKPSCGQCPLQGINL
jgi:endonuclease III related protein